MSADNPVSIADCLSELRQQILDAHERQEADAAQGKNPSGIVFVVEKLSLQLEVLLTRSTKGGGKLQYLVASLEGGVDTTKSSKQILTLTLQMVAPKPVSMGKESEKRF